MKKIFSILAIATILLATSCAKDYLNTDPTDRVSGTAIFTSAENAMTAVNGLYRMLYTGNWGDGWAAENGGLPAFILAFDLMAEDHMMDSQGSGWFYEDYRYGIWGDYTHNAGRQYQVWNFFYSVVCNANYILANTDESGNPTFEGDPNYAKYVVAQAYAMRSYAYMMLVQMYQQNDPSLPGVPLYSEPTVAGSEGKGRGTVKDVYDQANKDIDKAIELLEGSSLKQQHKSHIDKYVAYGLKARHALVQQDFATALDAAKKAMGGAQIAAFADIEHVNSIAAKDVMWGLAIQTDQAIGNYDIYAHMDADSKGSYSRGRHLISNWLYDQMSETDARRGWWTAPLPESEWGTAGTGEGSKRSWCQKKLVYINAASSTGDHILMRVEEMYLTAAEAACRLGQYDEARKYLKDVCSLRDSKYQARLDKVINEKTYNTNTVGNISTLMDEILLQRRIELWGELPRMFDLQRLHLGFDRNWAGTNHTLTISSVNTKAGSPAFILWIPQSEFDGNSSLDPINDQNPSQRN